MASNEGSRDSWGREGKPIIARKITVPGLPNRFAARPRLEDLLADLLRRNDVLIVSASPGAGKTTAAASAVCRQDAAVAWLTIDRSDRAPGRLVTYLEAALARVRPHVAGVASGALAAGLPHVEAAGLLAEAIGGEPTTIVLDELERLGDAPEAWSVIESLLRYTPPETRLVLISRRDVPTHLCKLPAPDAVAVVTDADLAFTPDEAARALARLGKHDIDARVAVRSTSGWVTGVLFEAWKTADHVSGQGGETDPLYDYLSSQILSQLSEEERDFLVETSLLDEVTASRAQALGRDDAAERLRALRPVHLPVTWDADRSAMRCHPYFREYLLARLERRGEESVRALRVRHARRLAREGHDEEAVEELLQVGAIEEALEPAQRAIASVVERFDLAVAERWLAALAPAQARWPWPLITAELMVALAEDQVHRGLRVLERLEASGQRESYVRSSERAAWLMAWCYLHAARADAIESTLAAAAPGPGTDAVRYAMRALTDVPGPRSTTPPRTGEGTLEALTSIADYCLGRLAALSEASASPWEEAVKRPWRIAALRALGRTQRALELYEEAQASNAATATLIVCAAPEVLLDAGQPEEAERVLREGRRLAAATGSLAFQGMSQLVEAKIALRADRDVERAQAALGDPACRRAAEGFQFFHEIADTWSGLAQLLQDRDAQALVHLRRAVRGMVGGDRILELPTAAVYLAEAEWRAGDEDAADRAADLALVAAERQGSNHLFLQALVDFPAVASRRIDAEAGGDSPWHELGRALIAQKTPSSPTARASVVLQEFGRRAILVNGREVRARIGKSYELLAYLATIPSRQAHRDELLSVLFDGRRDDSSRAYLRQAIHWLRNVLPEDGLSVEEGVVRIEGTVTVESESVRFQTQLVEAARLQGEQRLQATLDALSVYDRGPYLPGQRALWADARQEILAEAASEARYQAAVLSFNAGAYDEARRLALEVLHVDPYREAAWRLVMRVAQALGDEDAVIRAFQDCEAALGRLGTTASPQTRQLLEHLRR